MRVLITGATGLVGSKIVALCHKKGIHVNYLTTREETVEKQENYRGFHWDPEQDLIDPKCFDGVTAIINLAGASISRRWTKNHKRIILSSRINSLRTLAKGLEQNRPSSLATLVSASAIGIYPNSLSEFYSEDEAAVDDSFLGEVVYAWENEVDTFRKFNLSIAKLRIGLVLATEGGALPEIARPVKFYAGAGFGSGLQWQSWIHIKDLARMFLYITEHQLEGVYNGVAPNPVTNNKLVREVAQVLSKPLILPNIPEFIMKLILGEMAYILFASQRVNSKKIENKGFDFRHPNIGGALRDLFSSDIPKDATVNTLKDEFPG